MNAFSTRTRLVAGLSAVVFVGLLGARAFGEQQDTRALMRLAAEGRDQSRYTAIDDLGEHHNHPGEVVPALQKLLSDADPQVRWRSARALGDFGDLAQNAAGDLRRLLKDPDPIIQYHAAATLGKIGDKSDETVDALVAAATSQDDRVARAAIAALRNLRPGPQRVMAALRALLKSDDQAVIVHALEAIVEQGAASTPLLNEALKEPETSFLACAAIEQIGPEAKDTVPALTDVLGKTKHSKLLIQALLAVAAIGPDAQAAESAVAPLLDFETDVTVPVAAAYALGAVGAKNADAGLQKALAKNDPFLQMMAAWAIAKTHPGDEAKLKQAVDKLTSGLASDDAHMRKAAAKALQALDPPPELVQPAMIELANDPDPEVVKHVVEALASRGESLIPRAVKALQNPKLRGLAVRVLTKLGPKAADAVGPLTDVAGDADPNFRAQVNLALAAIGPAAAPATPKLVEALSSTEAADRESALLALRQIGPGAKAAVVPLSAMMKKDESFDSMAAAWALARIAPNDAKVAEMTVPKLTAGLANEDEQTRMESVEALAAFGQAAKSAGATLQALAQNDGSKEVRDAAKAALKQIAPAQ